MVKIVAGPPLSAKEHVAHVQGRDVHVEYQDAEEASEGVCNHLSTRSRLT